MRAIVVLALLSQLMPAAAVVAAQDHPMVDVRGDATYDPELDILSVPWQTEAQASAVKGCSFCIG